jgi:hypothetical protein
VRCCLPHRRRGTLGDNVHHADADTGRDRPAERGNPRDSTVSNLFGCRTGGESIPNHRQRTARHKCRGRARGEAHGLPAQRLRVGHALHVPDSRDAGTPRNSSRGRAVLRAVAVFALVGSLIFHLWEWVAARCPQAYSVDEGEHTANDPISRRVLREIVRYDPASKDPPRCISRRGPDVRCRRGQRSAASARAMARPFGSVTSAPRVGEP